MVLPANPWCGPLTVETLHQAGQVYGVQNRRIRPSLRHVRQPAVNGVDPGLRGLLLLLQLAETDGGFAVFGCLDEDGLQLGDKGWLNLRPTGRSAEDAQRGHHAGIRGPLQPEISGQLRVERGRR